MKAEAAKKYGLRALAINEDSVREASLHQRDLFAEFAGGDGISVGVMSPQMLRSPRISKLLKIPDFKLAVRWMLIDEVHVIDEESGTFRESYKAILPMRSLLPSNTIWAGVTGTATPSRALAIAKALGFQNEQYVNARYSVDRPNIKYIPRFFEYPTSGFEFLDLSFVIPYGMKAPQEIPSTLIFAKTIQLGYRILQYLDSLIPLNVSNRLGIIKLYNALMPLDYRREFIVDIGEGSLLRVGVVTDTCTYGTDIPTLTRVIIAHVGELGDSPEVRKQQMGRPGRDGKPAVAIVYAPAWVRDVPAAEITTKQERTDLQRREQLPAVTRDFFNPTLQCCSRGADLKYNGETFVRHPNCCVLHDPEPEQSTDLAMVKRWAQHFKELEKGGEEKAAKIRSDGTYRPLDTRLKASFRNIVLRWRTRKYSTIRGSRRDGFSALILPEHLLQRIVDRAHACSSLDRLWGIMHDWDYLEKFGDDLFNLITEVMPEFTQIMKDRQKDSSGSSDISDADSELDESSYAMDTDPPLQRVRLSRRSIYSRISLSVS